MPEASKKPEILAAWRISGMCVFGMQERFRLEVAVAIYALGVGAVLVCAGLAVQAVEDQKDNAADTGQSDQPPPAASAGIMQSADGNGKPGDIDNDIDQANDRGVFFEKQA